MLFKVLSAFQSVQEFILCKNDLSDTHNIDQSKMGLLKEVRSLNLEETNLSSFQDLKVLS